MKRIWLIWICLSLLVLLSSCAVAANPLIRAESTPVPGLPVTSHAVNAPESLAERKEVTLFFRYQQSGLLACETREILIPKDESPELAVIRQLLAGPKASHADLTRLFPHTTTVLDVTIADDTLMVTLNEGFLNDGVPETWADDPLWQNEAPLRRKLTIHSLVATITENFPYPYVQVFFTYEQTSNVSTRLDLSYFLSGQSGPSERLFRDESVILTMQNTATTILDAWYRRDYQLLYQFTASNQVGDERPSFQAFANALDTAPALISYSASAGHSAAGSANAIVTLSLTGMANSHEITLPAIPLRLVREDGIWKLPYSELERLMLHSF